MALFGFDKLSAKVGKTKPKPNVKALMGKKNAPPVFGKGKGCACA